MRPLHWVSQLGPPLLLAAATLGGPVLLPASLLAGSGTAARGCPPAGSFVQTVASATRGSTIDAQLHLSATLGTKGELTGRVLTLNTAAGGRARALAAESFASAAQANVVVFGQYDAAAGSTIGALDLQTGCEYSLWATADVVRSAVIDAGLDSIYVHTVAAADRADRGIQRVDLASSTSAVLVPPLLSSATFGTTFATLLRWSLDGDALAVQSCGLVACRTRALELANNTIETYAGDGQGQIVGLTAAKLVTFDACPDLPCAIVSTDRPTGRQAHFDVEAFAATLAEDELGPLVTVVTAAGTKEIRP